MRVVSRQSACEQRGAALPLVLLTLLFLTLLGTMALNTASVEVRLAANERDYQQALYVAEGGLEHMRAVLMAKVVPFNQVNITNGNDPDWNFALTGPEVCVYNTATFPPCDPGSGGFNATLAGFQYHVYVYDNDDGDADLTDDSDSLIYVRSDVVGAQGTRASIEMTLNASGTGTGSSDYSGQYGSGAGKNFSGRDRRAITDMTTTDLGDL